MRFTDPDQTYRWAEDAMRSLRAPASRALSVQIRRPLASPGNPHLGCGAYGCVFETDRKGLLAKLTTDPEEAGAAHHIATLQPGGWLRDAVRIKSVHDVGTRGEPKWLILRERVRPPKLSAADESILWETNGEIWQAYQRGIKADPTAMKLWPLMLGSQDLLPLARLRVELLQLGLTALDLRAPNVGRRAFRMEGYSAPGSVVLLDLGGVVALDGTPLPTSSIPSLIHRGAANRACPGQGVLEARFAELLGRPIQGGHCEIVPRRKLKKIAEDHGWKSTDSIVGFHTPDDRIFVRDDSEWSVAHELAHRYGLDDDHMGRWICEALTEFVAEEAARLAGQPHRATYPHERSVLLNHVCPATGKTPVEIARVAASSDAPAEALANLMRRDPAWRRVPRRKLVSAFSRGSETDQILRLAPR